jgi:hypothetical protein
MDLFEENSVVNIMSSIVGSVFGFKAAKDYSTIIFECLVGPLRYSRQRRLLALLRRQSNLVVERLARNRPRETEGVCAQLCHSIHALFEELLPPLTAGDLPARVGSQ